MTAIGVMDRSRWPPSCFRRYSSHRERSRCQVRLCGFALFSSQTSKHFCSVHSSAELSVCCWFCISRTCFRAASKVVAVSDLRADPIRTKKRILPLGDNLNPSPGHPSSYSNCSAVPAFSFASNDGLNLKWLSGIFGRSFGRDFRNVRHTINADGPTITAKRQSFPNIVTLET